MFAMKYKNEDVSWKDMITKVEFRATAGRQRTQNRGTKTALAWSCDRNGPPAAYRTASTILGGSGFQERTRSAKDKLQRPAQSDKKDL